ncbi:MAG: T9SS type A sorting domain-containing protein, partial [Cytophagales bacterium]|nr:T9SS type A sorting domain-containing protein [Cytophagales bacterium]
DEPRAVIATQDNGYLVGGWSWSGMDGNKTQDSRGAADYWVVKIDGSGNKQWDKRFGGNDTDQLYSLAQNSDGSYLLAGSSRTGADGDKLAPNRGAYDYWMLKADSNGNKLWDRNFGGNSNDYLQAVAAQPDGYLLAGYTASGPGGDKSQFNRGDYDFWVVKTTLGSYPGAVTSLSLYNALTDAYLDKFTNDYTIALDAPGASKLSVKALTSGSIGSVQFKLDGVVIRTENAAPYTIAGDSPKADGSPDFLPWTPSPGYHQLVVTPYKGSNGTGLVGTSYGVKFRVINSSIRVGTGVAAGGTEPEMAAPEVGVFPNPFAEDATLSFRVPASGPVSLTLHDARGNLVRTLHQGEAGAGRQYQYPLHRAGLEAGLYFGRLVAGHRTVTQKIMILR